MGTPEPSGTKPKLLSRLRILLILSALGIGGGWGVLHFTNQPTDPAQSDDEDDLDSLVLQEVTESASRNQSPRKATASFTNVVTADHRESDDAGSAIVQARFASASRPASNPSVWLTGTIEIESSPARSTPPQYHPFSPK